MFKKMYNRFFKKRFFNRVSFIYVSITVVSLFIISMIITSSISRLLIDKEMKYNEIILTNLNSHISGKYDLVRALLIKAFHEKYYMDRYYVSNNNDINKVFDFLQNKMDKLSYEYLEMKPVFDNYFSAAFSYDKDIMGISIYKQADQNIYQYSKNISSIIPREEGAFDNKLRQITNIYPSINVYPAYKPDYADASNKYAYTLSVNIKSLQSNSNIGILMIDFDTAGITQLISILKADLRSDVVILQEDGSVIYDSFGKYYQSKYEYLNLLNDPANRIKIDNEPYIVNVSRLTDSGIITAIITPEKVILEKVSRIKQIILFVSIPCILLCIILMIISSKIFSKQINIIVKTIKKMRDGDFSIRIPVSWEKDELGEIAESFNKMNEHLSDYIQRVYISEIKQKGAELTALQAQINPHFLYNTLETIRMKAVKNGDIEVGNMICILAKLFRSSIKGNAIISIDDEMKYCEFYLKLFQIRYEFNFSYSQDVEDDVLLCGIPKHLLQPLIENYIMHGFTAEVKDNWLSIKVYMSGPVIYFDIEDNGNGIKPDHLGEIRKYLNNECISHQESIGLKNVSERIKIIYGSSYGIEIDSAPGKGTKITIRIPAIERKELDLYVQGINR